MDTVLPGLYSKYFSQDIKAAHILKEASFIWQSTLSFATNKKIYCMFDNTYIRTHPRQSMYSSSEHRHKENLPIGACPPDEMRRVSECAVSETSAFLAGGKLI